VSSALVSRFALELPFGRWPLPLPLPLPLRCRVVAVPSKRVCVYAYVLREVLSWLPGCCRYQPRPLRGGAMSRCHCERVLASWLVKSATSLLYAVCYILYAMCCMCVSCLPACLPACLPDASRETEWLLFGFVAHFSTVLFVTIITTICFN
jgi:hypothetical protein